MLGDLCREVALFSLCLSQPTRAAALQARTPLTAFTQAVWFDPTPAMPQHTPAWDSFVAEVEMKPDLDAKGFSISNAFFFSGMSRIAYASKDDARGLVMGNSTCTGLGFSHFHWFEGGEEAKKYPFDAIHDTEAFVAANDDIIAVIFRGTKEIADWYTNMLMTRKVCPPEWGVPYPGGSQHQGFDDGVQTVWDTGGMYETIKTLYNDDDNGKRRKLYLAGHSLGGALATNAAARLAFIDDFNIAGIYTIGSPRLFDRNVANFFDCKINYGTPLKDKYFRCKNNADIVTTLPGDPYIHVGTEIFLDQYGTLSITSMGDRILDQLIWCLRGEFIKGIDDHSSSEYVRLFKQAALNSRVPMLEKAGSVVMDAMDRTLLQDMPGIPKNNESLEWMRRKKKRIEEVKVIAREAAQNL